MTPEEIKDLLNKSGYLFEQKVASHIQRMGFNTSTNRAFLDKDEKKSREIDVVAHKVIFDFDNPVPTVGLCYLNCECKNSTTPFIFITRNKGSLDRRYKPDGIVLPYDSYFKHSDDDEPTVVDAFIYMGLHLHHFATRTKTRAVQLCKIIQNGSKKEVQHSGIIESFIYPLIKSKQIWESTTPKTTDSQNYCKIFFNLAIVNSDIYTIDSENDSALPEKANFVPFVREIRSDTIQGNFLITFVNYNYLENFINNEILVFCEKIHEAYKNKPELLRGYMI